MVKTVVQTGFHVRLRGVAVQWVQQCDHHNQIIPSDLTLGLV